MIGSAVFFTLGIAVGGLQLDSIARAMFSGDSLNEVGNALGDVPTASAPTAENTPGP